MPRKPLDGVITDKICYADALSEAQNAFRLATSYRGRLFGIFRTNIWDFVADVKVR